MTIGAWKTLELKNPFDNLLEAWLASGLFEICRSSSDIAVSKFQQFLLITVIHDCGNLLCVLWKDPYYVVQGLFKHCGELVYSHSFIADFPFRSTTFQSALHLSNWQFLHLTCRTWLQAVVNWAPHGRLSLFKADSQAYICTLLLVSSLFILPYWSWKVTMLVQNSSSA